MFSRWEIVYGRILICTSASSRGNCNWNAELVVTIHSSQQFCRAFFWMMVPQRWEREPAPTAARKPSSKKRRIRPSSPIKRLDLHALTAARDTHFAQRNIDRRILWFDCNGLYLLHSQQLVTAIRERIKPITAAIDRRLLVS
jgi:hypothetical protein